MPEIDKKPPVSMVSTALIAALRRILRPFVKLLLHKGITYTFLIDIIKQIFVEVADKEFSKSDKPATDSYLSLITGVHRKDIKRLRADTHTKTEIIPETVSFGARLVSLWISDPNYLDENDHPIALPRFIKEGGERSFEGLVTTLSRDIRSRVVLDEWLRLGVVHFDEQKRVCLNVEAFIPAEGFEEKAFYFGHNLSDHTAAAANNLLGQNPAFLDRCVHYNQLSAQSIKTLAKQSEAIGMKSLLALNKKAMALEKDDAVKNETTHRMTFGIYFFSEPVDPHETNTPNPSADNNPSNKGTQSE